MEDTKNTALQRDPARLLKTKKVDKKCVKAVYNQNRSMLDAARATVQKKEAVSGVDPVIIGNPVQSLKDHLQQHKTKAPAWRFINTANAVFMNHYALKEMESENLFAIPFTFNLTPGLLKKASASKKPLSSYLLKRLAEALQRELNRKADFYLVIEVTGASRQETPHIHGEILLTGHEMNQTRTNLRHPNKRPIHKAFHSVNDYSDNNLKNSAFKLEATRSTAGWPDYLTKHLGTTAMYVDGSTVARTQGITRAAKVLYQRSIQLSKAKKPSK